MANYIEGIDVSKYQGVIDWPQVAAAGKAFAFIRQGYINGDGSITVDDFWERNMKGAIAAGLQVGAYLYSYLRTPDTARIAAARAMELCAPYGLAIPIALDYEHAALYQSLAPADNAAACNAFLQAVEAGGYLPVIYTYYAAAVSWLPLDQIPAARWLANYTGKIGIDGVDIWQHSSSGAVPGIAGRVDLNRAYNGFWDKHPNGPPEVWQPLTGKVLEVFGSRSCEYFNSCDVNDVAGRLESGKSYPAPALRAGVLGGYSWCTVRVDGRDYCAALLDDRCRLTDAPGDCGHAAQLAALESQLADAQAETEAARAQAQAQQARADHLAAVIASARDALAAGEV